MIDFRFIEPKKNMSGGLRCLDRTRFTDEEIAFLRAEIRALKADESKFIFNDPDHLNSTCYDIQHDVIFVGRNVFPDIKSYSIHPRYQMSPRAVLAHEYYGHREACERYAREYSGEDTPLQDWEDEALASANAALNAPGLSRIDRVMLLNDAGYRAREKSHEFIACA